MPTAKSIQLLKAFKFIKKLHQDDKKKANSAADIDQMTLELSC